MENKTADYAILVYRQIVDMINNEDSENYIELNEENLTDFFTALTMGCSVLFNKLTGDKKSYLEYTYIVNQLIVQYIMDKSSVEKLDE